MPVPVLEEQKRLSVLRVKHEHVARFLVGAACDEMPRELRPSREKIEEVTGFVAKAFNSPIHDARVSYAQQLGASGDFGAAVLAKLLSTAGYDTVLKRFLEGPYSEREKNLYPHFFVELANAFEKNLGSNAAPAKRDFYARLHAELLGARNHLDVKGYQLSSGSAALQRVGFGLDQKPDWKLEQDVGGMVRKQQGAVWAFDKLHKQREELLNVAASEGENEEAALKRVIENAKTILRAAPVNPGLAADVYYQLVQRFDKSGRAFAFADLEDGEIQGLRRKLEQAQHGQMNLF